LAIALGNLNPHHKPSYVNTEPPVSISPQPAWFDPRKIVSFDPWGHLVPQIWADQIEAGLDIRPSIAVTKAHIKLSELDEAARKGLIKIDGKLVLKSRPVLNADYTENTEVDPGVELACSKAAVEPVWFLPGVADRFKMYVLSCFGTGFITDVCFSSEGLLRRALFEDTGGMYPELITRPDIKVFLPPIGNLTVYICESLATYKSLDSTLPVGKPEYMSDASKELTLRVHDECNGSDVFGSDICTCKPYLIFAIEECIRCAQRGGVGVVVYFRKEGRALGEVTK
jgi:GTP cyclohydrolase II